MYYFTFALHVNMYIQSVDFLTSEMAVKREITVRDKFSQDSFQSKTRYFFNKNSICLCGKKTINTHVCGDKTK